MNQLYMCNLPFDVTDDMVKDLFEDCGTVLKIEWLTTDGTAVFL